MESGFKNLLVWPRIVDSELFHPARRSEDWYQREDTAQTVLAYVGRVSKDKSIGDFREQAQRAEYSCWVVGDGLHREELEPRYSDRVTFVGFKRGPELARYYASADVMVFTSRTDTFGNVITESMAGGTPVAAYPVTGRIDVIADGVSSAMTEELDAAVDRALECGRERVREYALGYSRENCVEIFRDALVANER